eukprot:10567607-Karenia_brevis.AAC.1
MSELMQFTSRPNETVDSLLSRFHTLRYRAQQGGTGLGMSREGYAWLLLKAVGVSSTQLLHVLQPFQ